MTEFKKGREKNIVEGKGKIERSSEGLGAAKSATRPSGFLSGLFSIFSNRKDEIKDVIEDVIEDVKEGITDNEEH